MSLSPRGQWSARVLLGAALLGSGCLPRPELKVNASDIGKTVTSLLAMLWVGKPVMSADMMAGGTIPAGNITQLTSVTSVDRMVLQDCTKDPASACDAAMPMYSFGLEFPMDQLKDFPVALVGVAAVMPYKQDATVDCLVAVASGQMNWNTPVTLAPPTMEMSFRSTSLMGSSCIPLGSKPLILAVSLDHTTRAVGDPANVVIIDGWGFRPHLSVTFKAASQLVADTDAGQIGLVTPTQIVLQSAQLDQFFMTAKMATPPLPVTITVTVHNPDVDSDSITL